MRIVVDMQGAQTESRVRGIGRYTTAFVRALVQNRGAHEVLLAFNGLLPGPIDPIQRLFRGSLPRENMLVWESPGPARELDSGNAQRRQRAEIVREAFLCGLNPDVIHVTSLFEGFGDDAVTSVGLLPTKIPTSVTLYDLIPLHDPNFFKGSHPALEGWYRQKLENLKRADLLLAISNYSAEDALRRLPDSRAKVESVSGACSEAFQPLSILADEAAPLLNRLGIKRRFLLASGTVEPHKNLARLFTAYALLPKKLRDEHVLVLVGKVADAQRLFMLDLMRRSGVTPDDVIITDYVSDTDLAALYNLCALMIVPSYDEGFGLPALEALSCGAAVIGSNSASVPEVIGNNHALFDAHDEESIARLIERSLTDSHFSARLKEHGRQQARRFSWHKTSQLAVRQFEEIGARRALHTKRLDGVEFCVNGIRSLRPPPTDAECRALATALAYTFPVKREKRQLFVDVSELAKRDARTGCQRVTRSIVLEMLKNPPPGFEVEPVWADCCEQGYCYARSFTANLLGKATAKDDGPIDFAQGDIFFGLDYQAQVVPAQENTLRRMRRNGVRVFFLLYDILSVTMPEAFLRGNEVGFRRWLETIAKFDGTIAISKDSSDAFEGWCAAQGFDMEPRYHFSWVHLGADIEKSAPTFGLPEHAAVMLDTLKKRTSLLMVGTLEPRKGHAQALAAVELLWNNRFDVNLVIVGQEGWDVAPLAGRLRRHAEYGHRLFWLEGISDEYLEKIYAAADCLLAASKGEGFGLPLIEAARHRLPLLVRDLPVFREVAGDHAAYFSAREPRDLAHAIESWLEQYKMGTHPRSDSMPWITWKECSQRILQIILD